MILLLMPCFARVNRLHMLSSVVFLLSSIFLLVQPKVDFFFFIEGVTS